MKTLWLRGLKNGFPRLGKGRNRQFFFVFAAIAFIWCFQKYTLNISKKKRVYRGVLSILKRSEKGVVTDIKRKKTDFAKEKKTNAMGFNYY